MIGINDCKGNVFHLVDGKKKEIESYSYWRGMMTRVYKRNSPTYKDVTVCKEWHRFSNFKKWFDENYYTIEGYKMSLDKDILKPNNNIYCPEYCCFVPLGLNAAFSNKQRNNKTGYTGVNKGRRRGYTSFIKINGKNKNLGTFETKEDAYFAYCKARNNHISSLADKFKEFLPENVYLAMKNYDEYERFLGHANNELNNRADELCNIAMDEFRGVEKMKKITLDNGKEFNIRLVTSREEVTKVYECDDIDLGRYYDIAHDNNISKCSSEFKYITKTLVEEAIENKDKLYNEDDVGIVFCVNEKYYRIGCPTTIGLDERCQASCRTCWKESLKREGVKIESFNKALKEHNIDKKSIIKHISKKEKLKTLEDFRNGKDVEVVGIRLFKLNDKVYNSCPDNFGLESNETNEGCKFNPSCARCKNCWKKNIKDYLEGEE